MSITAANLQLVNLDGNPVWKLQCPTCKQWGSIDDDQISGRVSLDCPSCDFHQTHDLRPIIKEILEL